ncbi:putative very-long-chain (3R)-3-hydroxyacyl-CoA dehydratase [Yarrowia sp. C11]|nr:putative very-long-chain (3R)-3-hydroxyacyl-CoA dehydratase [Yarrowia sp. C11]KAG5364645.1 putative very-long-chain (3R)-3-hydroxyacyl-CoA dehydratase [Yarrowia sp. E02]
MASALVNKYLTLYNSISAFLWFAVFARLVILLPLVGYDYVSGGLRDFLIGVQTLAGLEIFHSLFGLVRSPLQTTVMQIFSRFALVWGVLYQYPETGSDLFFTFMVLAWSITEVIRYSFYALNLAGWGVPDWHQWIRYNFFLVLYPLGVSGEMKLMWNAIPYARVDQPYFAMFLKAAMVIWPIGLYILYSHMLKQRSKHYRQLGKKVL